MQLPGLRCAPSGLQLIAAFAATSNRPRTHDQTVQLVAALLLGELDGKSVRGVPDDAADAGADGERRPDRRLQFRRHGDA